MNFRNCVCTTLGMLASVICLAQSPKDTLFLTKGKQNIKEVYGNAIKSQSRLYNGSDYVLYRSREDEHPYFIIDDWVTGSITYDEDHYEQVPLMYDIYLNKILTEHILHGSVMELVNKKIHRFTIGNHSFVNLGKDDSTKSADRFHEVLYAGRTKVYATHEKLHEEYIRSYELFAKFNEKNKFFLSKDGILYPVRGKGSVIKVFQDKKQAVKRFVNKNNLNFRSELGESIAKVAAFYDTQNN